MIKIFTLILFFVSLTSSIYAQDDELLVKGKVVDAQTGKPIPVVRISSSIERVSTNDMGEFEIKTKEGDQLIFVHLTYLPKTIQIDENNTENLLVQMEERMLELQEFEVSEMPSEQVFKEAIMNANPAHAYERNAMKNNLNTIMIMKDLSYFHDFSSYNTMLKNVNTNGGVTFFSTNPSLGLIGALRKVINGKPRVKYLGEESAGDATTRPLWKNPLEVDSLKIE
ncbi:carboxypeptidase-like regulatory domain-containing protein [Echinicola sp. CAU 1574]|uniref:Carboxypeptidase-like regulatory domain-containing protein n=1 Tax=Echinicola arenosa TaxID=2774144 RepID=A0ABR9AQI2_9BACT|nr:carboxypeptidase-like regulatory domain-containing protein [Echinicola arenosa]MBD8491032.1 carboxypeptidase-like regulatory domain-containing protein [Echinicola arenosa]